jgi:hypothetical protein
MKAETSKIARKSRSPQGHHDENAEEPLWARKLRQTNK